MPQRPEFLTIARLMCDTTRQILWALHKESLSRQRPRAQLLCRPGSGRATYHRYDHRLQLHQITYGIKMVEAKHRPETAHSWLSAREICSRGYYGGQVSVLNLLAHTCVHEFAHLLQQHDGKRYHGSVHNRHFYQILDQLNHNQDAQRVRSYLNIAAEKQGIFLDNTPMQLPVPGQQACVWQQGDRVWFGEGKAARQGQITRINRKTCTVEGAGDSTGLRFRVPFLMLRPEP